MSAARITALVESELRSITQPELVAMARDWTIPPKLEQRSWDYSVVDQHLPCWLVVEHPPSNTGIAYCAAGFGPSDPWGMVCLSGAQMSMGTDGAWFATLEDALRHLPAWRGENPPGYEVR